MGRMENPEPAASEIAMLYAAFSCFGPIARTCLKTIPKFSDERYDSDLEDYLNAVDHEIQRLAKMDEPLEYSMSKHYCNRTLLLHPSKTCRSYTAQVATRWIAHRMAAAAEEESRRYFTNSSKDFPDNQDCLSRLAGFLRRMRMTGLGKVDNLKPMSFRPMEPTLK